MPDGTRTADPDHYSIVFENDVVRVLRISCGAHEQSVLHHHPANCFVSLDDGPWHMGNAEGEVTEAPVTMGQVACTDAEVHLPTNAMDDTGDVVLIEFKGRETVAS